MMNMGDSLGRQEHFWRVPCSNPCFIVNSLAMDKQSRSERTKGKSLCCDLGSGMVLAVGGGGCRLCLAQFQKWGEGLSSVGLSL